MDILLVKDGALYPVEIKKGIAPSKPTKNFNVLEKYKMPIKRGMVIDNAEKIRALKRSGLCFSGFLAWNMRGNKVIIVNITFIMFYFTGGMLF